MKPPASSSSAKRGILPSARSLSVKTGHWSWTAHSKTDSQLSPTRNQVRSCHLPIKGHGDLVTSKLIVSYQIRSDTRTIEARARDIAIEQSIEMPLAALREEFIRTDIV